MKFRVFLFVLAASPIALVGCSGGADAEPEKELTGKPPESTLDFVPGDPKNKKTGDDPQ